MARTRYLHLGKVALYQMSYGRIFHVVCRTSEPATKDIILNPACVVNSHFYIFCKK